MALEASVPLLVDNNNNNIESKETIVAAAAGHDEDHGSGPILSEVAKEIKNLYSIAFPLIISGMLVYGKSMISMLFMGRLGKDALAGGSLSNGIANITGISIISGLAIGMEGISSQACGAKQWLLMGQTLQRTIMILLVSSLPISILWLNIEPILVVFGQDPVISSIAAAHLAFCLPDLLFQSIISPLKIFLRTQNITRPLIISAAFALALHAPVTYLFSEKLNLGIRGIAAASGATNFIVLATLVFYIKTTGAYERSWPGWSMKCFQQWKPILRLALPSCVSVCLEWWWYELMILLSGLLSNATEVVATMGILLQATSLVYIFPSSLSFAVSTRVGNLLGAELPARARRTCVVALSCAMVTGVVAMSFMIATQNSWGRAFTQDGAILRLTAMSLPLAGLCELGNCPQTAGCGVLRGCARPTLGASINLGSFYGVGLPVALIASFELRKGLLGLWLGLLMAQAVCAMLMLFVLARTDWIAQTNRAKELIGMGENPGDEDTDGTDEEDGE